jgi:hypothetical protein
MSVSVPLIWILVLLRWYQTPPPLVFRRCCPHDMWHGASRFFIPYGLGSVFLSKVCMSPFLLCFPLSLSVAHSLYPFRLVFFILSFILFSFIFFLLFMHFFFLYLLVRFRHTFQYAKRSWGMCRAGSDAKFWNCKLGNSYVHHCLLQ